jgi:hypothetical protein
VDDLPGPKGFSGSPSFRKGISEARMRAGIQRWVEMRSVIESGVGASSDYWADFDRAKGFEYENGYQQVYDAFYGADCIKVNKTGNSYTVDNGEHRIWLAKQMSVDQLPMRIVEKNSDE